MMEENKFRAEGGNIATEAVPTDTAAVVSETLGKIALAGVNIHKEDKERLIQHLEANEQLLKPLQVIARELRKFFPVDYELALELFCSRSEPDMYPTFLVRHNTYEEDVMALIRKFLDEFEHLFSFKSGWIGVTTDFQSGVIAIEDGAKAAEE